MELVLISALVPFVPRSEITFLKKLMHVISSFPRDNNVTAGGGRLFIKYINRKECYDLVHCLEGNKLIS